MPNTEYVKAISDVGTRLHVANLVGGKAPVTGYVELVGVRSTPAKGEAPEVLDATVMSDKKTSGIKGRDNVPAMDYTFLWTKANVEKLIEYQGKRVAFLETLSDGTGHLIVGEMTFWENGNALNAVVEGTISITAEETDIVLDTSTYVSEQSED